jgi:NADP-dependent 3-hydroxy acid dehydrogenase YdfG
VPDTGPQGLEGAVALVTGASSGIGWATAQAMSRRGGAVALVARRRDRMDALAGELRRAGAAVHVIEADITDREQATAAVAETVAELGRLDIVVNNAGVMLNGMVLDAPLEEWERMVSLNVMAVLYITHAALPHLRAAAQDDLRAVSDLVTVSSIAGRKPNAGSAVYNLTKFGVGALAEAMRQELSPHRIRVGLVEPGATITELLEHNRDEVRTIMAGRLGGFRNLDAEDIAQAVEYIVTRPAHAAVNEVMVRPTAQVF